MSFTVVIPARYASSRLPGKPLADIAGKPMIQHVCERAAESRDGREPEVPNVSRSASNSAPMLNSVRCLHAWPVQYSAAKLRRGAGIAPNEAS